MKRGKKSLYLMFWAFIYRRTHYMHPALEADEYNYILDNINYIEEKYLEILNEGPDEEGYILNLDNIIGMEIGMYQSKYGLYTKGKHMIWPGMDLKQRIVIRLRRFFNI